MRRKASSGGTTRLIALRSGKHGGMVRRVASTGPERAGLIAASLLLAALATACGGRADPAAGTVVPVFDLHPSQCLDPPQANPDLSVTKVTVLRCSEPHVDEVYCVVAYTSQVPTSPSSCRDGHLSGDLSEAYPGEQALSKFAAAACLNEFEPYVGLPYTSSSLYYTYLYPSASSWDSPARRDRNVVCVIHTAGAPLTRSVKGAKL